jgi:hypothetical protein
VEYKDISNITNVIVLNIFFSKNILTKEWRQMSVKFMMGMMRLAGAFSDVSLDICISF